MVRILAVDTTTPSGSVAVVDDDRLLAETAVESPSTHSARLLAAVDLLLKSLNLDIQEIEGYAVTPGPGSFTGIRIGLSTVKSFAFASGKPIAPVSSLLALAWKAGESRPCLVAPMLDAKKGEIYAALYEFEKGRTRERIPQSAFAPERFLARLPAGREIVFIGNGIELCRPEIAARFKSEAVFSHRSPFIAFEVSRLGRDILKKGKGVSALDLEPLYFRKSQAEERHKR